MLVGFLVLALTVVIKAEWSLCSVGWKSQVHKGAKEVWMMVRSKVEPESCVGPGALMSA